ncbi:MAG: hypothetical protein AAGI24_04045 [Pseudomonadota bacterium]
MGLLTDALSHITSQVRSALDADIDVQEHAGRFTEDELGKILLKPRSVLVAVEQLPELNVTTDGIQECTVQFLIFVICSDVRGTDRHAAALALVEQLLPLVVYARWGQDTRYQPVLPANITAENLYSGDISKGKGIAWWAISFTQAIRN